MADIVQLGLSLDASKVLTARDKANRALDSISKSSKRTQASVSKLQRGFGGLLKGAIALVGIRQLIRGFQAMVKATKEGEQSAAKVNSVLRATEFAAGKTARAINKLSQSMADTTLFNDDEVRNLTAILLTFRKVQGQVFDDAIGLIADMATVMGTDLKSAALQVGKVLQDPVARIGEMSRAGIVFTQTQKDMVKVMFEAGNVAGAQGIILDELRQEFGGAAAGAQTGLFGSINSTTKAWNDWLEALGRGAILGPALEGFFNIISRGLNAATPLKDKLVGIREELKHFQEELERLEGGLPTRRRTERAEGARAMVLFLEREIKAIEDKRKAEEDAAAKGAADANAAADRERALALERESRLKAAQKQAQEFNEKQKAFAAAWQKSWGRAIENIQDSSAQFFRSLLPEIDTMTTEGVSKFELFAKRILDIWLNLTAQIAATRLFGAFLSTGVGQSIMSPGIPALQDVPTALEGELTSVAPPVTVIFNVAAMDAGSFQVFAEANKGAIAGAVAQAAQDSVAIRRAFRGR